MKFERIKDMAPLKREIISYLFEHISRKKPNQWYKYSADFTYENVDYTIECECMCDNEMFTYKNLHIEYKQIVIDVDEMNRRGLLN